MKESVSFGADTDQEDVCVESLAFVTDKYCSEWELNWHVGVHKDHFSSFSFGSPFHITS